MNCPDLKDLSSDGDMVEIDGRIFRLRIEPDECSQGFPDEHGEVYGRFAWVNTSRYCDHEHDERPDGFTGNAEILCTRGGDPIWWEPYDIDRRSEHFREYRQNVLDILEYGWLLIGLEELGPEDFYGRPAVLNAAWLSGVEPFMNADYVQMIVSDLYAELVP